MQDNRFIAEDRISFKNLYDRVVSLINHLLSNWKSVGVVALCIFVLYVSYSLIRKPVYTAETTFVLEVGGKLGGSLSSLASVAGVNLDGLSQSGGSTLFEEDNIAELYRSRKMLQKTLLTTTEIEGSPILLIDRLIAHEKLREKWDKKPYLKGIDFSVPPDQWTVSHDSILYEVIKVFREKSLVVEKPSRLLSILSVKIHHKDELFAKHFNEELVKNVNRFYQETKTKKTGRNLKVLQHQADSVKQSLDRGLEELGKVSESQPNLNPLLKSEMTKLQKLQIDIQTSAAAYEQIVTNLEITKISHRNNMPLIQIIDEPILPLPDDKHKLLKLLVLATFISGSLTIFFFTLRYIFQNALKD